MARNLYESLLMQSALGDTIRPGGFDTTKRAIEFCKFKEDSTILDLGCGKGATIKYLKDNYNITAKGLDVSTILVNEARKINQHSEIVESSAKNIPFKDNTFSGVFAECTLSLMDSLEEVIDEVSRVMKIGGYFVISDMYSKMPTNVENLEYYSLNTCLKNPHNLENLKSLLAKEGFNILLEEKYDNYIKNLIVKIIFQHGSMEQFWKSCGGNCLEGNKFQNSLTKLKLGYFLVVAKKEV